MRALLAEDDRMIGEAVVDALKDASYAVDWVRDGDSACAALDAQVYDIVLLDLGPRMRAVARRKAGSPHPILSNGRLDLDPATREVSCDRVPVRLTAREFALLRALLLRPGA